MAGCCHTCCCKVGSVQPNALGFLPQCARWCGCKGGSRFVPAATPPSGLYTRHVHRQAATRLFVQPHQHCSFDPSMMLASCNLSGEVMPTKLVPTSPQCSLCTNQLPASDKHATSKWRGSYWIAASSTQADIPTRAHQATHRSIISPTTCAGSTAPGTVQVTPEAANPQGRFMVRCINTCIADGLTGMLNTHMVELQGRSRGANHRCTHDWETRSAWLHSLSGNQRTTCWVYC